MLVEALGAVIRAIPPVRGKGFVVRRILAPCLRGRGYEVPVRLRGPGGGVMRCRLDDWIPWNIYVHGRYLPERRYEEYMLGRVRPGMTVFDVGANIGYYTVQFGRLLRGTGALHAFEPTREQYDLLCEHLRLNHLPSVHAVRRIVSRQPGPMRIYHAGPANTGSSSIEIPSESSEEVEATTLDAYCRATGIPAIDLLKIDVEGHELSVLEGASTLLAAGAVRALFVEVNSRIGRHDAPAGARIVGLLERYGYRPRSISTGQPRPYEPSMDESLVLFERP